MPCLSPQSAVSIPQTVYVTSSLHRDGQSPTCRHGDNSARAAAIEEAATLAACLAQDTIASVRRIVPDVIVAYAPADGRAALEASLTNDNLLWLEQRGADLGARLEAATAHAASLGYAPIIIVGTDSPTLPLSSIERAIHSLSDGECDIALGPTEDGGYYLVGLRRHVNNLFQNITWSTPLAYKQTADNAARLNLCTLGLQRWYDVDTFSDLLRLRGELRTSGEARAQAPNTYQWLQAHDSRLSTLT
ncbi:MAG: TIGR04282 family arsenosugar biosynthesis glycosyltransferase [Acidobacteriota bacterium]|nr:TIGR04282 family arsenosugar biosynthesis glycosyltransferase [Acidobacteriota bacterium]